MINIFKKKIFILTILSLIFTNNIKANNLNKKNIIKKKYIYIKNNVFLVKINKYKSDIEKIILLKYKNKLNKKYILTNKKNKNYFINNKINILKKKKINFKINKIIYKNNYIILISKIKNNKTKFIKKTILNKKNYEIYIIYEIKNNLYKNIYFKIINNLYQKINNKKKIKIFFNKSNYINYDINKKNKNNFIDIYKNKKLNWISIYEKYFISTIIPINNKLTDIFIKKKNNNIKISYKNIYKINKKNKKIIKIKLWIGPKLNNVLNKISPKLEDTIEYGKLQFLSKFFLNILFLINKKIKNWGYSIIILTFLIKIITYPLNKIQYESYIKINKVNNKIKKIKKKYYKNNKLINNKIIKLYKKFKINPFINILLTLIQIPIFLSIYNLLTIPIELKNSKFIFWIKDLSMYDKYFILPIIMSFTIYITQNFYTKKKNNNKYINIIIVTIITTFFMYLPSGLLIYYIINNFINIIQQYFIKKNINK